MSRVYLPAIHGNGPTAQSGCTMTRNAQAFADAWSKLLGTKAHDMVCDSRLVAAAQKHATWLDANNVHENRHYGEGGTLANARVRAEGYKLPDWYPLHGNQIESVGECYDGEAAAVRLLVDSPLHHDHVMREGWWAKWPQPVYGVGNAAHYYVVITCPIEVI